MKMQTKAETREVRVWDPLIRIFHWTLVVSFVMAYLSGEEMDQVHLWSGYLIAGLLVFRLIWGFVGSKHARFRDFLFSPRQILAYGRSLMAGRPKHYLGHNPAGAVMVFLLLFSLSFTVASGLMLDAGVGSSAAAGFGQSVLPAKAWADDDDDEDEKHSGGENEILEETHEFFANLTLLLVFLHIAGVVVSGRLHRENLVRAMITGNKLLKPEDGD
jgi:cytochrome b